MSLYHNLQKRFIDNFRKEKLYPDMDTARCAFEAYWECLEAAARTVYKKLQKDYGVGTGIVTDATALNYVRHMYECSDTCAKEIIQIMTLGNTSYHIQITERQGGGIVL